MPSILFGTDVRAHPVARGDFFCPGCREPRRFQRTVVRRTLRLAGVFGLPAGRCGEFVECERCRATFRPEVLAYHADGGGEPATAEYQRTLRRVLALMVVTDGRVHGREVETVQEVFEAVSGERLRRDAVQRELDEVTAHPTSVPRLLARAMGYLNEYGKEQILRGCVLVSRADDHLHPREVEMMRHLGGVLRLEAGRVDRLLHELA